MSFDDAVRDLYAELREQEKEIENLKKELEEKEKRIEELEMEGDEWKGQEEVGPLEKETVHTFEFCNWCNECKPSHIPHLAVHIRSNEGTETYWVCEPCLEDSYTSTNHNFPKYRRKRKRVKTQKNCKIKAPAKKRRKKK